MSQRYKLYRRTSGIYVVRISIPQRFRRYAGQCEIHTSTGTHDLHEAKQKSALLLAVWYQTLQEYEQLDYRTLSDCAPLLAGEGMISLSNFAQSVELPVAQLIQAVMNRNLPVCIFTALISPTKNKKVCRRPITRGTPFCFRYETTCVG